ncbi:CinA family protein [Corynebacterium sp. H128]|uniref:CinA family protein n=1 Tax=Corynebacterium sp. H128 TaxID=3133427 RepID=UPI00309FA4D8
MSKAALVRALKERSLTVATCESLTAGLLASSIADVPGASDVLVGGLITYSNDLKTALAGVPASLIDDHGAVSAECAAAMAAGTRDRLGSDWALALTGVAGPASQEGHPAGVVWLGVAGPEFEESIQVLPAEHIRWALRPGASKPEPVLDGDRNEIRLRAAEFAIEYLVQQLGGN